MLTDEYVRAVLAQTITQTVIGTQQGLTILGINAKISTTQAVIALRVIADTLEKAVLQSEATSVPEIEAIVDKTFNEAVEFHREDVKRNG